MKLLKFLAGSVVFYILLSIVCRKSMEKSQVDKLKDPRKLKMSHEREKNIERVIKIRNAS